MGEGYVKKFIGSVQLRLSLWLSFLGASFALLAIGILKYTELSTLLALIILVVTALLFSVVFGFIFGRYITKPTESIAQTILHVSPSEHRVPPPNFDEIKFGHDLVATLARQIYNFGTTTQLADSAAAKAPAGLIDLIPVPIMGVDEVGNISLMNNQALSLTKLENPQGQPLLSTLKFITNDENTIEAWLQNASASSLTDKRVWQKIELKKGDGTSLGYFDIAISFNKHSGSGHEAIFALFDHSDIYQQEDDSMSFIALAVHELRTPLTIMRGYIEAFRDEIGDNATPQIKQDLQRMNASAATLTSFVSNILNVARVNQGQLSLKLHEDNWNQLLPQLVDSMRERAGAYGKNIELRMQPGMPSAAVDRMTIGEVMTNLIDNAIKYSPDNGDKIEIVSQINKDGQIETTVRDFGVGIPESVMPNLFTKFYRNHRTKGSIGGTGLGLYLSKAIVNAHNGNIWVSSKVGEGSTFGFTIMPYEQLAKDQQSNNNENIIRSTHGWIKNHSMQRR